MKRITWLLTEISILVLVIAMMVTGVVGCGRPSSTTTTAGAEYKLVHNLPDLEYILPWGTIAARIPDMNDYTK